MPDARRILDSSPPLTPSRLRDFPYAVEVFPFDVLRDDAGLTEAKAKSAPAAELPVNSLRVQ